MMATLRGMAGTGYKPLSPEQPIERGRADPHLIQGQTHQEAVHGAPWSGGGVAMLDSALACACLLCGG